jgi:hypothetical protein
VQFRDVFEVDGDAVRDRSDRLTKLFLEPVAVVATAGGGASNESRDTTLVPSNGMSTCRWSLMLLDPMYQMRFAIRQQRAQYAAPAAGRPHSRSRQMPGKSI